MTEPAAPHDDERQWPLNYFNYFTEIEDHFQRARGTGLFLLSPLDWALIETWKTAGVPLGAVLQGIDEAFEKWRSRKQKRRMVNSLAYCAQSVLEAAQQSSGRTRSGAANAEAPFPVDALRSHLQKAIAQLLEKSGQPYQSLASSLAALESDAEQQIKDVEDLERRLTALEDKMVAAARSQQSEEDLYAIRKELDAELKPYRGKMTADQLSMLERRYLDRAVLERAQLPRLSLFYLL